VEKAADIALASSNAGRWVTPEVNEVTEENFNQERRGRPGEETSYRKTTRTRFTLTWQIDAAFVAYDAASDGCFPLITNDTNLADDEVLAAYKYQPNLERRHAQLKGTQLVAPVFLKDPARIEGLLCCHFIALLVQALIERQVRTAMVTNGAPAIPLYPEERACTAPSSSRVLEIFTGIARHQLMRDEEIIQVFQPSLDPLQGQVLGLLGVPPSAYVR
jgi:transposase